ncbi:hypothetical protein Tco_1186614, partial [Tanacetum coccineum]
MQKLQAKGGLTLKVNTSLLQIQRSSLLLLLNLKGSFCQVVEVADGLMEWTEGMLGFIHIRP